MLRLTWDTSGLLPGFAYRAVTFYGGPFQVLLLPFRTTRCEVPQPRPASGTVWAVPLSLATTHGIAIAFFSFGY